MLAQPIRSENVCIIHDWYLLKEKKIRFACELDVLARQSQVNGTSHSCLSPQTIVTGHTSTVAPPSPAIK